MSEISNAALVTVGGGRSGLSAAKAAQETGLDTVLLEAGDRPVGSWPRYYDSLTVFSPAEFSAIPGLPFPADPDHYPRRDEVVDHLARFAKSLDVEIRTNAKVESVERDGRGFLVRTASAGAIRAGAIVAASGSFGNPYAPVLPGQERFAGQLLHSAGYRNPHGYAGKRVVVVGAGNSAIQIGYDLAKVATVTLATRKPIRFWEQRPGGRDLHHILRSSGFDDLPFSWVASALAATPVLDTGVYQQALDSGVLDRRPMFTAFEPGGVVWSDGSREHVDAVIFATGYRPDLGYLRPLGALDADGMPRHDGGLSTTCPGLAYVGLEFQRSFSSNTLRGAYRDAQYVVTALAGHLRDAAAVSGL